MQFSVNSIINEYFRFCSILNNILGVVQIFLLIWQVLDKNCNLNVAMTELQKTSANYNRLLTNLYYYGKFITHCYFQLFKKNVGVPYMLASHLIIYFKFYVMSLNLKLAAMNPHGWYPPAIIAVDNTGNAWRTSSALKAVMVFLIHLYVYFHVFSYVFYTSLDWLKSLETEIMYFEIIAYLKYLINNFTVYLMSKFLLTILRCLDPPLTHMLPVWTGKCKMRLIFWNLFSAHGEIGFEPLSEVTTLTSGAKHDLNQCKKENEDIKVESEIMESKYASYYFVLIHYSSRLSWLMLATIILNELHL